MTAKRTDANQKEIVKILRNLGASVLIISDLGKGVPDLCIGYRGRNYLLELKDGKKPPSARRLTQDEQTFHDEWLGQVTIISSLDEALTFLNRCLLDPKTN